MRRIAVTALACCSFAWLAPAALAGSTVSATVADGDSLSSDPPGTAPSAANPVVITATARPLGFPGATSTIERWLKSVTVGGNASQGLSHVLSTGLNVGAWSSFDCDYTLKATVSNTAKRKFGLTSNVIARKSFSRRDVWFGSKHRLPLTAAAKRKLRNFPKGVQSVKVTLRIAATWTFGGTASDTAVNAIRIKDDGGDI
jgi:hypothetical protein